MHVVDLHGDVRPGAAGVGVQRAQTLAIIFADLPEVVVQELAIADQRTAETKAVHRRGDGAGAAVVVGVIQPDCMSDLVQDGASNRGHPRLRVFIVEVGTGQPGRQLM